MMMDDVLVRVELFRFLFREMNLSFFSFFGLFAIVSDSDCLGSAFNAANEMRCPVCRAAEEGVWRSFPTRAPRGGRAGARAAQEDVPEPATQEWCIYYHQCQLSWILGVSGGQMDQISRRLMFELYRSIRVAIVDMTCL